MKRFFKTYTPFTRAGVQQAMAYRANFVFFLLGELFKCFVVFFVWKAVFDSSNSSTFMGFTMDNMIVYLFISFLTSYLSYSDSAYNIAEEIVDGSVSMRMIKPCSFDMCFLFQELGNKVINYSVMFVPLVLGVEIYRYIVSGMIQFDVVHFVVFLISLQLAYLISFYFNLCFGFIAFFSKHLWGINLIKEVIVNFLSGATIPLAFMPELMAKILTYMPFSSLSYTPVMIYMGMYSPYKIVSSMALQLVWLAFFAVVSKIIWHYATKRLCVQGG